MCIRDRQYPEDEEHDYATPVWSGILPMETSYTAIQDADRLIEGIEPSDAVSSLEGKKL